MNFQISEGLEKKFIADALTLSYLAFSDKLRIEIKNAEDFVALFSDTIQPGNCLSATKDNQLAGLLTFQTTEREFYPIKFRDIHAKKTLFPSLLIFFNLALFHKKVARDELYIDSLVVSSDFQGQGIGSALIEAIEESARIQGKHKVTLDVLATNTGALRLYENKGFKATKSHRGFLVRLATGAEEVVGMEKIVG